MKFVTGRTIRNTSRYIGVACAAMIAVVSLPTAVSARSQPYNEIEQQLPALCSQGSPCAMIWFSQPGEPNYYKVGLTVDYNQTGLVDIVLRGSGYTGNKYGPYEVASMHLDRNMNWYYNPNSRIKNVQASTMYRGYMVGRGQYSSQGGEVRAQLDISGFDVPAGQSRTFSVGLYSCMSGDGGRTLISSRQTACGVNQASVTITRRLPPWTINGQSYVGKSWTGRTSDMQKSIQTFPGEQVYWAHDVRNNGPNPNNPIELQQNGTGFGTAEYNRWHKITNGRSGPAGKILYRLYPAGGDDARYTTYRARASDIGKQLCQQVSWSPAKAGDSGWGYSDFACAKVRSDFELYPSATIDGKKLSTVEGGNIVPSRIEETIHNTGGTQDIDRSESEAVVYQFIVRSQHRQDFLSSIGGIFNKGAAAGYPYALASYAGSDTACTWLRGKKPIDCAGSPTFRESRKYLASYNRLNDTKDINAADAKVGDMICRIVAIKDYNYKHSDANERRVSSPACVTVTKLPWVQVWGGDVRVGNGIGAVAGNGSAQIVTLKTTKNGAVYGSWGEYGMVAPQNNGTIISATGGVLSGKNGYSGDFDRYRNNLAFANTSTTAGRWAPPSGVTLPNFGRGAAAGSTIDIGAYSGNTVRTVAGNATIHGTLPGSSTLVIEVGGTVTIDGDIRYGVTEVDNAAKLPQLVIKAKNIIIKSNVKQVNAWLIAQPTATDRDGVISTCDEIRRGGAYYSGLNVNTCKEQLVINGTIIARQIQLRRTFGAEGAALAQPAEVLNQRADVFMWGSRYNRGRDVQITTATTTEVAPRF